MEQFVDLGMRDIRVMLGQKGEEGVAQEREVGQRGGVACARVILAPYDIAPPVIADLDATPMPADELLPLGWGAFCWLQTGEIVAGFGRSLGGFLGRDLAPHDADAAGERETSRRGFEGKGGQLPELYAPVTGRGLGKKGVPGRASSACACLSRPGWLPLIWKR